MHQLGITTKFFSLGMFLAAVVALVAFNMPHPAPPAPSPEQYEASVVDQDRLHRELEQLNRELEASKQRDQSAIKSRYLYEKSLVE